MNKNGSLLFQIVGVVLLALAAYLSFTIWNALFFIGGVVLGSTSLWLDKEFFFSWYQGKTIHSTHQYITRSLLFILAYGAASIFVVTSTSGLLGRGLVLGIGLVLLSELLFSLTSPSQLNMMLGVKKPLNKNELNYLVGSFALIYIFLLATMFVK